MTRGRITIHVGGQLRVEWADVDLDAQHVILGFVDWIAAHVDELNQKPHLIEIEFLDEPNPNERYFRFGTAATRMGIPIRVDARSVALLLAVGEFARRQNDGKK